MLHLPYPPLLRRPCPPATAASSVCFSVSILPVN
ncbi:hypothetical protein A2U01_0106681, partial [Trifolium medium]|nr:hypothetical protein [Trifolium medium]